jgi:epoxyqueuosine reductase
MISAGQAGRVKAFAGELGFDLVAFTHVEAPEADRDFFLDWCRDGMAAGMAWLTREPSRRAEPRAMLAEALGVITLGVSYFQGPVPEAPPVPAGRVARYAWGRDYHDVIQERLERFALGLRDFLGPGLKTRFGLDAQPLLERAFARRAGLGFAGKNTNLIAPRAGSWIFLTELLVNRALPADEPAPQGGCGGCTRCMDQCPTDALREPYRLDARACIAYHTIENRGWIPRDIRSRMGAWLFGCDECQDACPFNARAKETRWPEFGASHGAGPWVPLAEVLDLHTPESFKARFKGTPLLRAKRAGLVRNACVAAANARAESLAPQLEDCLGSDADPVVRGHAAWALGQFPGRRTRAALENALAREETPEVRHEITAALSGDPEDGSHS